MSTGSPIKFRCFQCNKLLGVSQSKANTVVTCPQCAAQLIVPDHSEPAGTAQVEAPPTPQLSSSESRIEPVVVLWDKSPDPDPAVTVETGFPVIQIEPLSLRPDPPARLRTATRSRGEAWPETIEASINPPPRPEPPPAPRSSARREPSIANVVKLEAPALREDAPSVVAASSLRDSGARRNDVVLPRTAVVLWSFLVLLAIVLAFSTGLLAGRFLWAPGVPVKSAVVGAGDTLKSPR